MKKMFNLVLVLIVIFICGCSASRTVSLSEKNSGQSISLKAGDMLRIVLAGNPTTGYTWNYTPNSSSVVKQKRVPSYKTDKPGLLGSGGKYTFTFIAAKSGKTRLELLYRRTWEKNKLPAKTFYINITAK